MSDIAGQSGKAEPLISTTELLAKLPRWVTARYLKNERDRGFLPPLEEGGCSPLAASRAKRLYRLRQRGAEGLTLKVLLFLADGWGWDDIRADCIKGLDRVTAVSLNGVARYERAKEPLDSFVDDIAEHQHKTLLKKVPDATMNPTSPETMAFVIGILTRGTSLEHGSATRILTPIIKASWPEIPDETIDFLIPVFEVLYGMLDMRATKMLERLSSATPEQVERGRHSFTSTTRSNRILIRNIVGTNSAAHTNLLTGFNHARELRSFDFSIGDIHLSPPMVLAGMLGFHIAYEVAMDDLFAQMMPLFGGLTRMFLGSASSSATGEISD